MSKSTEGILPLYNALHSDSNALRRYSIAAVLIVGLLYTCMYLIRTCVIPKSDSISERLKKNTLGFKSFILSFSMIFSVTPLLNTYLHQPVTMASGSFNSAALVSVSFISGLCIVLRRYKERSDHDLSQYALFTLSLALLVVPWVMISGMPRIGGVFGVLVYLVYVKVSIGKGKDYWRSMESSSGTGSSTLLVLSPIPTLGAAYFTYLWRYKNGYVWVVLGWLCMYTVLLVGNKKGSIVRECYVFGVAMLWVRMLMEHLYGVCVGGVLGGVLGEVDDLAPLLGAWRMCLPVVVFVLVGSAMDRYRLCISTCFGVGVCSFLFNTGVEMIGRYGGNEVFTCELAYSIVFFLISVIVLFVNDQIRNGMFEVEVGGLLIGVYGMFVMCMVYKPGIAGV